MFVVIRLPKSDRRAGEGPFSEEEITLTKAFLAEEAAQGEAARMNELNGEHWSYSVNVVRLVEGDEAEAL
jgi:hypothetical protein